MTQGIELPRFFVQKRNIKSIRTISNQKKGRRMARSHFLTVQGSTNKWALGLVNFVLALAYHFSLNLPAAFTQPGARARLLVEPFTLYGIWSNVISCLVCLKCSIGCWLLCSPVERRNIRDKTKQINRTLHSGQSDSSNHLQGFKVEGLGSSLGG